jgi:hypothetical protein
MHDRTLPFSFACEGFSCWLGGSQKMVKITDGCFHPQLDVMKEGGIAQLVAGSNSYCVNRHWPELDGLRREFDAEVVGRG